MVRLICNWQMLQSGQDNDFLHHRCGRRDRCGRKLSWNAFLKDLSGLGLPRDGRPRAMLRHDIFPGTMPGSEDRAGTVHFCSDIE
jgi:hypothetical protein